MLALLKSSLIPAPEILTDGQGVDVSHMRKTLEEWPAGKQKPKVFYTVPVSRLHAEQDE
jgi:tryptophan aminotransferase